MDLHKSRRGFTLLELLVVIAISAVLIGLLVVAVQRVRETAARTESMNNVRQIVLATHNFADSHKGRLPTAYWDDNGPNPGRSLFAAILPFIDQGAALSQVRNRSADRFQRWRIKVFISPADPTDAMAVADGQTSLSSYAANAQVFRDNPRLPATFPDGTSNTVAFAEHYSYKCGMFKFQWGICQVRSPPNHAATFAEFNDVTPVTSGNPRVSRARDPWPLDTTFQAAPAIKDCDPSLAQTPHRSGMIVALADGSVRTLSPSISPATYWGLVTPSGGEILDPDW